MLLNPRFVACTPRVTGRNGMVAPILDFLDSYFKKCGSKETRITQQKETTGLWYVESRIKTRLLAQDQPWTLERVDALLFVVVGKKC